MSIEARERGPEVAINCSALLLGVALSYWVSFGFTRMTNQISWVSSFFVNVNDRYSHMTYTEIPYCNAVYILHNVRHQHVLPPRHP